MKTAIKTKITIDPMTRIEGHLKIEAVVDNKKVVEAKSEGTLYRGFEQILVDRNPLDAIQITQRMSTQLSEMLARRLDEIVALVAAEIKHAVASEKQVKSA